MAKEYYYYTDLENGNLGFRAQENEIPCDHDWLVGHSYDSTFMFTCSKCKRVCYYDSLGKEHPEELTKICLYTKKKELRELYLRLASHVYSGELLKIKVLPFDKWKAKEHYGRLFNVVIINWNPETHEVLMDMPNLKNNVEGYVRVVTSKGWPCLNECIVLNPEHDHIFDKLEKVWS